MDDEEGEVIMVFETSKSTTRATAGEQFIWEFLPSGIIECQTAKCMCCGAEFTDYVD